MGSFVKKVVLPVAAIALIAVPGLNAAAAGALGAVFSGTAIGGGVTAFGFAAAHAVLGTLTAIGLSSALSTGMKLAGLGPKKPNANAASQSRLYATIDPDTARKMVFGHTALGVDVRYQAYTGADQEYYHQVVAVASHKVASIDALWLDDKLAWTAWGGVGSEFAGYLTVTPVLEGSAANAINIDGTWNAANGCRLTGCAYLHLIFKLTGNSKKAESPFARGLTNRYTIRGTGASVYDPRKDSTQGGSGSQRADDQATWAYDVSGNEAGRNPALVLLAYLLGWKINGKLAVGRGMRPERLDLASFIDAANLCDESVALAGGGNEPRYRFDGIFAEDEDGDAVIAQLEQSMNAKLEDDGGRLSLRVSHNDLAVPVIAFETADIIGKAKWNPTLALDQTRNIVRGRYTDASDAGLYQLVDYPASSIPNSDGIDRILSLDFAGVQSASQAQRLAKQQLQRLQYPGTFTAPFNAKAYGVRRGDVVTLTLSTLGWVDKLFRVRSRGVPYNGVIALELLEEHEDLYAWDAEEAPAVLPAAPESYNQFNDPLMLGIAEAAQAVVVQGSVDDATWHAGLLSGDIYMRVSVDGGATFGPGVRIKGDDGLDGANGWQIELVYQRAASIPAAPTGNGIPAGWDDDPPSGTAPLWMSKATQQLDGTLIGSWTAPVRVDGPAGADAVVYRQDTTPPTPTSGNPLWVTASAPLIMKRWSGAAWVQILGNLAALDLITVEQHAPGASVDPSVIVPATLNWRLSSSGTADYSGTTYNSGVINPTGTAEIFTGHVVELTARLWGSAGYTAADLDSDGFPETTLSAGATLTVMYRVDTGSGFGSWASTSVSVAISPGETSDQVTGEFAYPGPGTYQFAYKIEGTTASAPGYSSPSSSVTDHSIFVETTYWG